MKVSGILMVLMLLLSISTVAAEKDYKKLLGVWEFVAPNAPQPYQRGTLTLKESDQKLAGEFTVQGQALAIPRITFGKDTLTLGFEVENNPITLKLRLSEGVLEGTTQTPDGPVKVTAKSVR